MSVSFQRSATILALPGPVPGSIVRQTKRQAVGRTAGGALYTYDKGVSAWGATLTFESLSDEEKSDLVSFFHDVANGVMNSFTYTDSTGHEFTARFASPDITLRKVAQNVWDVTVELELDDVAR